MKKRSKSIAEDLRRAIAKAERGGMTRYRIAKTAKMNESQLKRVADGVTVPTLTTAERIAEAIGCRLTIMPILAK
jgi:DNA-binding phage protein